MARTLQDLPVEILERILIKAVLIHVDSVWERARYKVTPDHYAAFASVWSEWRVRLLGSWVQTIIKRELRRINPLEKYREIAQLVHHIETSISVWGLALLRDELFVSSIYSRELVVYSSTTFEQRRTMLLPDNIHSPRDIAACHLNACLYLVEEKAYEDDDSMVEGLIVRVDRLGVLIKAWDICTPSSGLVVGADEPYNLSVTHAGSLLVACAHSLREYSCDGDMLRRIMLFSDGGISWQAPRLETGDFLLKQGWSDSSQHRICVMNSLGVLLLSSVDGPDVLAEDNLYDPVHSVRDRNGCIVIADSENHRVVLLSPKLVLLREIVGISTQEALYKPYRVLLDEASGHLFIGTENKNVFVYRVFN